MTTLAANKQRPYELGERNHLPMIAADIIYEGAAVGIVYDTGHARPLAPGDRFAGFAVSKADNSAGAAAALNVEVVKRGEIELAVSGAVITDIGQPVYATDDDTFGFSPVSSVFVGKVKRFVSSGVVVVSFDADGFHDPYKDRGIRRIVTVNKTLTITDSGKTFFVATDGIVFTMPAVATPVFCRIVNIGAFGTVGISVSPDAADKIQGPDIAGTDNKDLINTKATAQRGDFVELVAGDANGPIVANLRGTWATEA